MENESSWQDFCLDPHHTSLEEGKIQGRQAGEISGFRDGQAFGQSKGLEYGLEIGFYQGILTSLQLQYQQQQQISTSPIGTASPETTLEFKPRTLKCMESLQAAMDDFPLPDQLFETTIATPDDEHGHENIHSTLSSSNNDSVPEIPIVGDEPLSLSNSKLDILHLMQRIRARFKLLMVQLGRPQYTFRHVMEQCQPQQQNDASVGGDSEW